MHTKALAPCFDLKALSDAGEFSGYGSTNNSAAGSGSTPDSHSDLVAPGAFSESLAKHRAAGTWPALLWNHDPATPIGEWLEMREDDRGLFVRGRLWIDGDNPDQDALKAYRAMKAKNGRLGLSIGFRTIESSFDRTTGIRTLTKVELWECSCVLWPSNSSARVTAAKSIPSPGEVEKILRDAGFSRSEAKALLSGGYKAAALRDADTEAHSTALAAEIRASASALRTLIRRG